MMRKGLRRAMRGKKGPRKFRFSRAHRHRAHFPTIPPTEPKLYRRRDGTLTRLDPEHPLTTPAE